MPALEERAHVFVEHFGDESDVVVGRVCGEDGVILCFHLLVTIVVILREESLRGEERHTE